MAVLDEFLHRPRACSTIPAHLIPVHGRQPNLRRYLRHAELRVITNERIAAALRRADGNVSLAARGMGRTPDLLDGRIRKDPLLARLLAQLRALSRSASTG